MIIKWLIVGQYSQPLSECFLLLIRIWHDRIRYDNKKAEMTTAGSRWSRNGTTGWVRSQRCVRSFSDKLTSWDAHQIRCIIASTKPTLHWYARSRRYSCYPLVSTCMHAGRDHRRVARKTIGTLASMGRLVSRQWRWAGTGDTNLFQTNFPDIAVGTLSLPSIFARWRLHIAYLHIVHVGSAEVCALLTDNCIACHNLPRLYYLRLAACFSCRKNFYKSSGVWERNTWKQLKRYTFPSVNWRCVYT